MVVLLKFNDNREASLHFVDHIGEDEEGEGIILQPQFPWEGSDRDYEYEEVQCPTFSSL